MYKWNIEVILKNGEHLFGIYQSDEDGDSIKVAKKLFFVSEDCISSIKGITSKKCSKETVFFRINDVASYIISPLSETENLKDLPPADFSPVYDSSYLVLPMFGSEKPKHLIDLNYNELVRLRDEVDATINLFYKEEEIHIGETN